MSRAAILRRVRAAIAGSVPQDVVREYCREGTLSLSERIAQFESRLEDYNAQVSRCRPDQIATTVAQAMERRGKSSLVVPCGIPAEWLRPGVSFVRDADLSWTQLDECEGALTGCTAAISFTGSIILTHSESEGRRALTLIPDYHLCVVEASRLCETVPEGLRALQARRKCPITTISGPSATADIEMTRIKGVHGPRTLEVILVLNEIDERAA